MTTTTISLHRGPWLQRLSEARDVTDALFRIVRRQCLYERPIAERHRIVFYIGHLEAFDWNLFRRLDPGRETKSAALDRLFAFGIDPVDGGLPNDSASDWPRLETVETYVRETRHAIDDLLSSFQSDRKATNDGVPAHTLLNVAIEHRLMHAETLAYMFHQLPHDAKVQPRLPEERRAERSDNNLSPMVEVSAGIATLGLRSASGVFGWDNEFPSSDILVPAFQIDKYMITNGQFLEFLEEGGYRNSDFWRPEDWQWRELQNISHPVFWTRKGTQWFYRGMFEEFPLPLDWPVYVSFAEATAFANWSKKALPTEEQWHRAAFGAPHAAQSLYPWGETAPSSSHGNFDFHRWDPSPVDEFQYTNASAFGAVGMLGNGWEWTSTPFAPFPGFQPFSFYSGYSANFFDGKHFVLKGGSSRTAAPFLRRSFRNWFQPHYQYVYAGFRCVSNAR